MCHSNRTQRVLEAEWMAINQIKNGKERAVAKTDFLVRLIEITRYHGKILRQIKRQRKRDHVA